MTHSRLLVATTNLYKLDEITEILSEVPLRLTTLSDWPTLAAPEETGRTFDDNARQKALYYAASTNELTVAEDSGLEIDALAGAPGVESARYGGRGTTYEQKFHLILDSLNARGAIDGPARFVCALALAEGANVLFETRGTIEGRISATPKGRGIAPFG